MSEILHGSFKVDPPETEARAKDVNKMHPNGKLPQNMCVFFHFCFPLYITLSSINILNGNNTTQCVNSVIADVRFVSEDHRDVNSAHCKPSYQWYNGLRSICAFLVGWGEEVFNNNGHTHYSLLVKVHQAHFGFPSNFPVSTVQKT